MDDMSEIEICEENLRRAMLAGDVGSLSLLMDDRLIWTGPDGTILTKEQDLSAHVSGKLKLAKIDLIEIDLHRMDGMVAVTAKTRLSGSLGGAPIGGTFAHTRLWSRSSGQWRVIVGHASVVG